MHPNQRVKITEFRMALAVAQGGFHSEWGWVCPCLWCGVWLPLDRLTKEHVVRRADGGRGVQNIALACAPCNNNRHDTPNNDPRSPTVRRRLRRKRMKARIARERGLSGWAQF